ncbi:MAG TPA: VOC family protein [Longimicrobiales bacterium]|nr:VOC family protein [Longimicrobiales bacterium]
MAAAERADAAVRRVGQILIVARDVARAAAFYRDVVGLRHLFDAPPGMSFFECGGTRLMIAPPEGGQELHTSVLYFDVGDINAAHAVLVARGAAFEQAPHKVADLGERELWLAFFRDSEGNMMGLMSEVPKHT